MSETRSRTLGEDRNAHAGEENRMIQDIIELLLLLLGAGLILLGWGVCALVPERDPS